MIFFVQTCKGRENFVVHAVRPWILLNHLHAVTWQSTLELHSKLHLHCNKNVQTPVYHTGVTLVVYIPKEQQRVTGVCVYNTSCSQPGMSGYA